MTAPDQQDTRSNQAADRQDESKHQPQSTAEWISLTIASLLLTGVIAAVGYLWASDRQRQPAILGVARSETRLSNGEYYVPFTVTNAGGETAESVQVIAELRINGETIESGEQSIEFLSSQETAGGAFVFTRNPEQGELVLRVASYQDP